eukprot:188173-Chlamydomonas_euryale.AAC.3
MPRRPSTRMPPRLQPAILSRTRPSALADAHAMPSCRAVFRQARAEPGLRRWLHQGRPGQVCV